MKKIKLVVVGPGLIGLKHIELILKNAKVELVAIVAPRNQDNIDISNRFNVTLYSLIEDAILNCEIDGVIIASPNKFHYHQAQACIDAKIPVLIEKPITATYEEAKILLESIERANAKVLVGHHRAHSPILRCASEFIKSGGLGELVCVTGVATFYKPDHYFDDGPWRKDVGGGPILINLIHEIGNLRALCGEIASVQAMASNKIRQYLVEDTVSINIEFANGALGNFMLSDTAASARSWEQTSGENKAYPSYKDEDCYVVTGTKGSISIPSMRIKRYQENEGRSWWLPFVVETIDVNREDPLECQLNNFLAVICNEADPVVNAYDGVQNLKVTEAVMRSANTNSRIFL